MKPILFSLIAISILLFACNKENKLDFKTFPVVKELKPIDKIALDSIHPIFPTMIIDGNYCCIADLESNDYYFHIFDYPSFKYIKSIGRKGHGASEITIMTDFDFKDGKIAVLCGEQGIIQIYDINDSTAFSPQRKIRLPEQYEFASIAIDRMGRFYLYSMTQGVEFLSIDTNGKILSEYNSLARTEPVGRYNSNTMWQSLIRADNGIMVEATIFGDVFRIKDTIGHGETKTITGPLGEPELYNKKSNDATFTTIKYHTYVNAHIGQQIYLLYRGEDMSKKPINVIENSIRAFDYQGNPIVQYNLDKSIEANSVYIDKKNNNIYILVPESETPIWVFSL